MVFPIDASSSRVRCAPLLLIPLGLGTALGFYLAYAVLRVLVELSPLTSAVLAAASAILTLVCLAHALFATWFSDGSTMTAPEYIRLPFIQAFLVAFWPLFFISLPYLAWSVARVYLPTHTVVLLVLAVVGGVLLLGKLAERPPEPVRGEAVRSIAQIQSALRARRRAPTSSGWTPAIVTDFADGVRLKPDGRVSVGALELDHDALIGGVTIGTSRIERDGDALLMATPEGVCTYSYFDGRWMLLKEFASARQAPIGCMAAVPLSIVAVTLGLWGHVCAHPSPLDADAPPVPAEARHPDLAALAEAVASGINCLLPPRAVNTLLTHPEVSRKDRLAAIALLGQARGMLGRQGASQSLGDLLVRVAADPSPLSKEYATAALAALLELHRSAKTWDYQPEAVAGQVLAAIERHPTAASFVVAACQSLRQYEPPPRVPRERLAALLTLVQRAERSPGALPTAAVPVPSREVASLMGAWYK